MGRSKKIMIVDDETIVGERLEAFLKKEGHLIETFSDPQKALQRLDAQYFDIVVTDIRMGEISGIQIMERAFERSDQTKVIIITGYATMELAHEAMAKGAFDFIAKPFKLKELRGTIQRVMEASDADDRRPVAGMS